MWVYLLSALVASGNILDFHEEIEGPGYLLVHKYLMFKKTDIYGSLTPVLKGNCMFYVGTTSNESGFIAILNSKEYYTIEQKNPCFSLQNITTQAPLTEDFISLNITSTGVYYFIVFMCTEENLEIFLKIESINPYGQAPGDLIYLIPVHFYLVLLSNCDCLLDPTYTMAYITFYLL